MGHGSSTVLGGTFTDKPSGVQFGHFAAGHVEKASAVLGDVSGIYCVDAEIDRLAPGAGRVIRMNNLEAATGRKVNIEMILILAEVRRPDRAVIAMKRRRDRTPVNEVRWSARSGAQERNRSWSE